MKVTGPPEHLLNEMKQQLELATTKCGSLQQELELIKDKVRKSSSQSVIKVEESNDEPEIEESDKNSISGDFPMGSEFDNEVRKFFLETSESRRPLSASSDSSDVKSTKSKQDIINIFFKRLETMENKEENSEPSVESKLTYDIDNSSIIDEFEDVGEFFSSFQNDENDEKVETKTNIETKTINQNKTNIENLKMKYKDDKIETLIKRSLSKIQLTKIKSSKNLKNTSQKKKINKHVVPVNDVINYMKKNTKREKMTKSTIRSVNRKETDFIKKNLIMNPKIKKSKSTVSAPLMGQNVRNKIPNAILPSEKKVEKIPPPPPPPPPPVEKKPKVEPDKKTELEKNPKIDLPKVEPEKKLEIDKKPKVENDKKPELVTSLVEKLNNVKKHQEQRSLITIPEKKLQKPEKKGKVEEKIELEKKAQPKNDRKNESKGKIETKVEEKIEPEKKTQPKILNDRKNESKGKIEKKVEEKIELEKKTQPKMINDRKNELKAKIEPKLPVKVQNKLNSKVESESKIKNEVVKKVSLFESKNLQKPESKMPKIDRKVSTMKEIFQPEKNLKGVQSLHSRVGSTLMQKMSKTTFNGEETIKSLVLPSFKKEKNFEKFSKIPFIVGQSTTKSYHIGLNIQQTLSLFKLTPSLTSLCDNGETKLERSPAYTILVTPERKMKKPCAACVNPQESDEEENGDPWSITDKIQSDQRSRQFSQCSCLPGKLMSFHQVLSQMFQPENTKMFNNYQTEEDSAESQKSCATYRENNAFHHLKLLRKIQKLQETFEKS